MVQKREAHSSLFPAMVVDISRYIYHKVELWDIYIYIYIIHHLINQHLV
jgi:hypothetical protein